MVSPLFFYQLVFFALIWFFVVLHLAWPKRPLLALATPPAPESLKPKRHRSVAYLGAADNVARLLPISLRRAN